MSILFGTDLKSESYALGQMGVHRNHMIYESLRVLGMFTFIYVSKQVFAQQNQTKCLHTHFIQESSSGAQYLCIIVSQKSVTYSS